MKKRSRRSMSCEDENEQRPQDLDVLALLDLAPVIGRDIQDRIIHWGRGTVNLYGYSPEEALGQVSHQLLKTRFPEDSDELHAKLLKRGSWKGELTHVRKDGAEIIVYSEWLVQRDQNGAGCAILEVNQDITERKKAETEQAVLAAIVENSPDAVVGETLDGIITAWNPGAERLFGYTASEAVGQHISILAPPEDSVDMPDIIRRASRGEVVRRVAAERVRKDGKRVIVSLAVSPVRALDGRVIGITKMAHDITEHRRAQQALRISEENLRTILNSVNDGILVHTAEGEVLDVNRRFQAMYGLDIKRGSKLSLSDFSIIANPAPDLRELWSRVMGGEDQRFEWHAHRAADGLHFDADVFLTRIRLESGDAILASVQDITARKSAHRALQRQNRQLSILTAAAEALLSTSDTSIALDTVYDRMADYFEIDCFVEFRLNSSGDALELAACKVLPGASRPSITRIGLGERVAGKVARTRKPALLDHANQSTHPDLEFVRQLGVSAYACEPLVIGDRLLGTLSFGSSKRDSFDAKDQEFFRTLANFIALARESARLVHELQQHASNLEQTVRERTAQLVEANTNLQSFAYTSAHDLRAALRSITSFSMLTLDTYGQQLGPQGKSFMQKVVQSAEQMTHLLNDLLEYSKLNEGELRLEKVDLEARIEEALALVVEDIRLKGARVEIDKPLPSVLGHSTSITLMVTNFISNALKFVAVGVRPQIRIRAELHGGMVRLRVEDNGIGIDPVDQEKIFQLFQRLHGKSVYAGTGLGLAIVRRAAERMGGRVGVQSQLGKGSTFWFELRQA